MGSKWGEVGRLASLPASIRWFGFKAWVLGLSGPQAPRDPQAYAAVRHESATLLAAVSAAEKVPTRYISYLALDKL